MPRRAILSATERAALLVFPTTDDELIRHYIFTELDVAAIRQRRGSQNRLGFAVQLCYLRYPGFALPTNAEPSPALLALVVRQLRVDPTVWPQYAQRAETRCEHLTELQAWLNLTPFGRSDYRRLVRRLAELVNAQFRHPFAACWGDGATSSSDGQHFKAGGRGQFAGQVNPKYGSEPGVQLYTHISDQYAPFHTKVISATVRDATHVLDGLLYHESDVRIEEHYTDTAGFTDHVFALMHLLGFPFASRIRDLADKRLYIHGDTKCYPTLAGLIGGSIHVNHIRAHWDEILRLAASIQQGTVTASLMLRKLGSYPRQNGLAVALRELGRIEGTLFTLDWLQHVELRRRV
jgi:TnpA family transposase